MQAVAHTLILLLILPLCLGICARYRVRNVTGIQLIRRISMGIVAAFATAAVPLVFFLCKCGVGNNPMRQVLVPAMGALLCVAAVGSRRSRWLSAAVLLAASVGLAWHFQSLVLPRDPMLCRYTGDAQFVMNSCRLPAEVTSAWYTPITGLYPLAPVRNR